MYPVGMVKDSTSSARPQLHEAQYIEFPAAGFSDEDIQKLADFFSLLAEIEQSLDQPESSKGQDA